MNKTSWILLATSVFFASLSVHLYVKLDSQREHTQSESEARNEAEALAEKSGLAKTANGHDRQATDQPLVERREVPAAAVSLQGSPAEQNGSAATTVVMKQEVAPRGQTLEQMELSPQARAARRETFKDVINSMFGDFTKEANLYGDQADRFTEYMLNRISNGAGLRVNPEDPAIREILDPAQLAQLSDYQKTLMERQQISQLRSQLGTRRIGPMSEDQEKRLFAVLVDGRMATRPPVPANFNSREDFAAEMSRWQADNDRRTLERAQTILNAEQLEVFRRQVENQARMRFLGPGEVTTVRIQEKN